MDQIKVLVVEDDTDINMLIKKILEKIDFNVIQAFSGTEAQLRLSMDQYDVVLLDLMLPGITGEQLIPMICEKSIPIIVLSAKVGLKDRVDVLNLGADDYITKPFETEDVIARVNAVLRRTKKNNIEATGLKEVFTYKKLKLSADSRKVILEETEIFLTAHEFDLLYLLMKNPQKVYSREALYEEVWQGGYYGEDNTVNVHISNIRKKISEVTSTDYIKTVWGIGFKLD